jgi:hypothetical protein
VRGAASRAMMIGRLCPHFERIKLANYFYTVLIGGWRFFHTSSAVVLGYGLTRPSDAQVVTGFELGTRT